MGQLYRQLIFTYMQTSTCTYACRHMYTYIYIYAHKVAAVNLVHCRCRVYFMKGSMGYPLQALEDTNISGERKNGASEGQ